MNINEIFLSIQGEGPYTGEKMLFIRTEYCNLRCSWCDTKYSFNEGKIFTIPQIIETVNEYRNKNDFDWICITGGEPLLQRDLNELISILTDNYKILLETSGSIDIGKFLPIYNSVYKDIDFKLPSSGMYNKFNYTNINYISDHDYIKFTVGDQMDFDIFIKEAEKINHLNNSIQFIIQPVWGKDPKWFADAFINAKLKNTKFMLQEHKYVFGDVRGK